jgi:DNA-binding response OmpR family regulator
MTQWHSDPRIDTTAVGNLQASTQTVVKVLLVSPFDEDHQRLSEILRHSKWEQYGARTQSDALEFLWNNPTPVAICESELPDGSWKDLLDQFAFLKYAPAFVVSSRLADEILWSEALNLGADNVLAKPFDMKEVFHVVSFAWLNRKRQWDRRQGAVNSEHPSQRLALQMSNGGSCHGKAS